MLLRCAPGRIAVREITRFAVITALLSLRRNVPDTPNFHIPLRLGVLADVFTRIPSTLAARRAITQRATLSRKAVWNAWASSAVGDG